MAIPVSGVPDQNYKPSLVAFDSGASVTFAVEGNKNYGSIFTQLLDDSGNVISSFSGGTQYTDAGTPPTHPVGPTIEWNNAGVWATVGSATPLPISLYLGTTAVSIGQQVAASSIPVILPSATITTLTPPSNTGYALDSSLSTINTSINTLLKPASTLTAVTTVSTVTNISQIASTTPTFTSQALDVNIKSETAPAVTLTRVAIAASSSGDNTLIAAVSGKKIYVVAFELSFSGTVNAKFTDGASGTNLGGLYYGVANAGAANSMSPDMKLAIPSPYLWVGSTNTALILNLSGAVAVGGGIVYFTV